MARLTNNKKLIKTLSLLPKKHRNQLLQKIDRSCLDSIRDCCKHILLGKISIKRAHKRKLFAYKSKLRAVANPSIGSSTARKTCNTVAFFNHSFLF